MTRKSTLSHNALIGAIRIALITIFATQLFTCTDEQIHNSATDGEEKMTTFSVKMPGSFTPTTYALELFWFRE